MKNSDIPVRWWGETLGESQPHNSFAGPCWLRSVLESWCFRPLSNRGPSPGAPSGCSLDLSVPPWSHDDPLQEAHSSPSPCGASRGQPWTKKAQECSVHLRCVCTSIEYCNARSTKGQRPNSSLIEYFIFSVFKKKKKRVIIIWGRDKSSNQYIQLYVAQKRDSIERPYMPRVMCFGNGFKLSESGLVAFKLSRPGVLRL